MNRKVLYWLSCLLILAGGVCAVETDFEVGKITLSGEDWGMQKATFTLKNVSLEMKTVIAKAETSFDDFYLKPIRETRSIVYLEPEQSADVAVPVNIPGNYGTCTIKLKIYDVVDTLDALMDSQMFHTRTFSITYPVPAELKKAVGESISVPPFVDRNDYYDHYFGRAMTYLLSRGKNVDEIAALTGTTVDYVNAEIADFVDYGYLEKTPDGYRPKMMVIDDKQVKSLRAAIDGTVKSLVDVITTNIPGYDSTVSALVAEGKLTSDPDNIMDAGSVLHHKYPVILGLLLWDILGKEFINDGIPFNIFEGSDPCNAEMGDFMYLLSGGADDVGTSFYYYLHTKKAERFHCGISFMPIICDARFRELRKAGKYINWSFSRRKPSVFHSYTEDKVRVPLSLLMDGTFPHIEGLRQAVDDLAKASGQIAYERGARLWCWSLVVTDVMRTLEKNGVIEMEGDGLYSMTKANLKR